MKKCFKCKRNKDLSEFYKHREMADGHLNKCKECTKNDTKENYQSNIEHYKEYDKERALLPKRVKAREEYRKTDNGKKAVYNATKKHRENNKEKYIANTAVGNALRDGRIVKPDACHVCGKKCDKICAHHYDYSKPLEVTWICDKCHHMIHRNLNKF